MSVPRIYWPEAIADGVVEITSDAAHHLRQVLRVTPGDVVGLFDGRGHEWVGQIETVSKPCVRVIDLRQITPVAEARVPVTLAMGVLKGDQMDAVVRDATMVGVAAIVPMHTAHVTVPPKAWQSGAARDRWQRVAIASAMQCRRAVVPAVHQVVEFGSCLREPFGLRLICVEPAREDAGDGQPGSGDWRSGDPPSSVQVLVGPEGGWTAGEVAQAIAAGAHPMRLGPRTLRAETTPTVALTLVSAIWGW